MLKKILSISGKAGLFELVSQGKNMLIVESLTEKKRIPAYSHEKIISLADIAIFTDDSEVPLRTVLESIKTKEKGVKASVDPKSDANALRDYFATILPNFDRNRVYASDIKKVLAWYNLLIETGHNDFSEKEENKEEAKA
ncbi:MAG TPA: DUF5606 domain-containing protein [Paludibacteraceae bacterium]|nr:DUF5606 domain-containing protein [Paludibacteraceae bacterium]HPH62827.1 DUF5606 domain-containing protein [Paludibacteraceae bacterium]HQF50200.1 DUF5606 domain-containing protein [Paludibacteraceae bacterium]